MGGKKQGPFTIFAITEGGAQQVYATERRIAWTG
jgi:hypothetical protein